MPNNKNQHYVPRAHLRPFTWNEEGKAINLVLFENGKSISCAPVKNQCSRSYFYGRDLKLENALSQVEGLYASALREINVAKSKANLLKFLRDISYLQCMRTELAIKRHQYAHDGFADMVFPGEERALYADSLSSEDVAALHLKIWAKTRDRIGDLRPILVRNRTSVDFVTSSDPSSFLNKFYNQRMAETSFGMLSSGLIIVMPLTPKLSIMSYDSKVYRIDGLMDDMVNVDSVDDIDAFNQFHMIKMSKAIYFKEWKDRDAIIQKLNGSSGRRCQPAKFIFLVPVQGAGRERIFRKISAGEDPKQFREAIAGVSNEHPLPERWMSFLRYRSVSRTYSNGSMAGHVRKREWLNEG